MKLSNSQPPLQLALQPQCRSKIEAATNSLNALEIDLASTDRRTEDVRILSVVVAKEPRLTADHGALAYLRTQRFSSIRYRNAPW